MENTSIICISVDFPFDNRYNERLSYSKLDIHCQVIRAAVNPLAKFLSCLPYIFEEYLGLQCYPVESDNFP